MLRWQAIVRAKPLATGNYGDGTAESYGYTSTKATNDANKNDNLRRLHIRLCRKGNEPDPNNPDKADKTQWSEEFIVTLGGTDGIEMRENHSYRLALSLTPSHLSAATLATFPTWAETETPLETDNGGTDGYTVSTTADGKTTWNIYTAAGLAAFATAANATDGSGVSLNATLMSDIDLSTVCGATAGDNGAAKSWIPIGSTYKADTPNLNYYTGTFNGQNHKIKNLYTNTNNSYESLFGSISNGATIRNIKLENANVTGSNKVGALIGYIFDGTGTDTGTIIVSGNTVTSATVAASNTTSGYDAGALIGHVDNSYAYIYGNTVNGTVTVTANNKSAGGIIGEMDNGHVGIDPEGNIIGNTVSGTVTISTTSGNNAGGIIGYMSDGEAIGNTVNGSGVTVTANGSNAGGIIGNLNDGTVSGNNVSGSVTVTADLTSAGGIIGSMAKGEATGNTVTSATITTGVYDAGGIIGEMRGGSASRNTVNGNTTIGNGYSGTLAGYIASTATLTNNTVAKTVTVKEGQDSPTVAASTENFVGSTNSSGGGTVTVTGNEVVEE